MKDKVGPWIDLPDGGSCRCLVGKDINDVANRVAFIEKTPRVRIRSDYIGVQRHWDDAGNLIKTDRQWPEFLNWCEGYKGDDRFDPHSREWCDKMLIALDYELS